MSEDIASAEPADGVTAGMLLRRARESAGLHVATLAVALKVPVRKLEALEEDRYDQLSDAVFVRALASSVCRTLKIDPQPILGKLPQSGKPRLVQASDGINAPFHAPSDGPAPGMLDQVTRPVGLVVLALLLGALVIVFLPAVRQEASEAAKQEPARPVQSAPSVVIAQVPSAQPTAAATDAVATASAAAAPASAPVTVASMAAPVAPSPVAAASSAAVAVTPAASAASAQAGPVSGIVVFRASAPSWVQVTDARGNAVLRKLMEPGETAGATGALPLSVTVGSAPSTRVEVRGKPFDLEPVTKDNVARFEVK